MNLPEPAAGVTAPDVVPLYSPPPGAGWKSRCAHAALRAFGWRLRYAGLPGPKGVIVAYPHTSNWDFFVGIATIWTLGLPIRWVGKESLFTGWFGTLVGPLLRSWGGRPVFRDHPTGMVGQLAAHMNAEPWCWLALSPEGTRARLDYWRSGFYHLARSIGAPVGVAYLDYPRREVGVAGFVKLGGDAEADMRAIARLLEGHHGLHPQRGSTIRLRESAD